MTSAELKSRIEKAEEKISKKAATIAKKEKWIAEGKGERWYVDDIKRLNGEIAETKLTIERYHSFDCCP